MIMRRVAPFAILGVLFAVGFLLVSNPPAMEHQERSNEPQTLVEVRAVSPRDYRIQIDSYGTVQPRTQSALVAQVSGQIVDVQPNFKPGGFFTDGEVLVTIDPRDYQADVKIAEAQLMDALQAQAQENARSEQALVDWSRLGEAGAAASELVLRKPQLEAARARVLSARAALTKAQLDLERTHIQAPFSGRVLAQLVDFGQVVNAGTALAEVYATDYFEVRLPLRNADLAFIELPEDDFGEPVPVRLRSDLGGAEIWQGRIVRTEGAIDRTARQLHVVAQIDDPFGKLRSRPANAVQRPLKIGEYVTAKISGKLLPDALVIPSETIYQNSYVYIVENGELQRRDLEIAWQNGVETLLSAGLDAGDALVTTPLGQISSGTPVRVVKPGSSVAADAAGGAE